MHLSFTDHSNLPHSKQFSLQISAVPDLTLSNPAGAGFGQNLFWNHRTICLMKLMALTMLSAAVQFRDSFVTSLFASF